MVAPSVLVPFGERDEDGRGGKSGLHRAGCPVPSGGRGGGLSVATGNTESATENIPPRPISIPLQGGDDTG